MDPNFLNTVYTHAQKSSIPDRMIVSQYHVATSGGHEKIKTLKDFHVVLWVGTLVCFVFLKREKCFQEFASVFYQTYKISPSARYCISNTVTHAAYTTYSQENNSVMCRQLALYCRVILYLVKKRNSQKEPFKSSKMPATCMLVKNVVMCGKYTKFANFLYYCIIYVRKLLPLSA